MQRQTDIRRAIVVVLDGLRPDAVDAFDLGHLRRVARIGASSMRARTVSPSLTWPALASLMTGVAPDVHGILADSVHFPRPRGKLHPLPELLAQGGYPSSAFMGEVPQLYRGIADRIAKGLGFAEARFAGANAMDVLQAARSTIGSQRDGLIFLHWADADRAGHAHGWMSPEYGAAARRLDEAIELLVSWTGVESDRGTVLILLADHGGGGLVENHHDGDHPLNWTVPLVLVGGAIPHRRLRDASVLDVPPTIAWALGVAPHASYAGRALTAALGFAEKPAGSSFRLSDSLLVDVAGDAAAH